MHESLTFFLPSETSLHEPEQVHDPSKQTCRLRRREVFDQNAIAIHGRILGTCSMVEIVPKPALFESRYLSYKAFARQAAD
jgi:hypothetical protein